MKSYLMHHGILGQKWGVRRYQNSDGTLTDAGKKRYAKELAQDYQKAKSKGASYLKDQPFVTSDEFESKVTKAVSSVMTKEDAENIQKKLQTARELSEKSAGLEEKFENKCWNEAYKECYDWFEKNEPDYLNKIIKENGGQKLGLDAFHDFNKAFEGYQDEVYSRNEKKFYQEHPEVKQADKAWDEYISATKDLTNKLLGEYGNIKVNGETLNSIIYHNVSLKMVMDEALKLK